MKKPTKRKIIYPRPDVRLCTDDQALTGDQAKELLGWAVESGKKGFEDDYDLKDAAGKKVRLQNNTINRKLRPTRIAALKQEIYRKCWHYNGQTVIIGKTGYVLDGANQLTALALASEEWQQKQGEWRDRWKTEPKIDKLIALGVNEDDDTVNTMDTGDPRSLTDVFYRSSFFRDVAAKDRLPLGRALSYATSVLWKRTGADSDDMIRTHSESVKFVEAHPKMVDCVKHIYTEESGYRGKSISRFLGLGYCAGYMYLMATSGTEDQASYAKNPEESSLDFGMWDKSERFFTLLGGGSKEVTVPLQQALAQLQEDEIGTMVKARKALVIKAWNAWNSKGKVTLKNLELNWIEDEENETRYLDELPLIGGIDLGE